MVEESCPRTPASLRRSAIAFLLLLATLVFFVPATKQHVVSAASEVSETLTYGPEVPANRTTALQDAAPRTDHLRRLRGATAGRGAAQGDVGGVCRGRAQVRRDDPGRQRAHAPRAGQRDQGDYRAGRAAEGFARRDGRRRCRLRGAVLRRFVAYGAQAWHAPERAGPALRPHAALRQRRGRSAGALRRRRQRRRPSWR